LDINITHPLWLCIQNSREDWKNKSETIKLMLSFSNNLEAPRIISELYKLQGQHQRVSEDERQDIEKMMNVIIDINYEKRHGIKRKLI
jgi:hypothetical protein